MLKTVGRTVAALVDMAVFVLLGGVAAARRKGVRVGADCRIYVRSFGSEPFLISIGDRVTITSRVRLLTHDGSTWLIRDSAGQRYQRYAPIHIGNDVFIGVDSIVMPGVRIGSRVVVGAGSVVTKDVPDDTVVAGNPARVLATFAEFRSKIETGCVTDGELHGISGYEQRVREAIRIVDARKSITKSSEESRS